MTGSPMGKATIDIPLVTWRDGRPRFFASPSQRALGFKGESLRHGDDGPWFTVEECMAWSEQMRERIALARAAASARGRQGRPRKIERPTGKPSELVTLAQVVEDFLDRDPRNKGREVREGRKVRAARSLHTVRMYRKCAAALEKTEGRRAWLRPVANCTVPETGRIIDEIEKAHGLSTARQTRAMLSQAFGFAVGRKVMAFNPVRLLDERLPVPEARVRPADFGELMALLAAADRIVGRPDVGDVIACGALHGASQADRLEQSLGALEDGVLRWRRGKTGAEVILPVPAMLAARLEAAAVRRRTWKVQPLTLFVDEKTRRPFKGDWYRTLYGAVRAAAVAGDPDRGIAPCPSVADLRDQDLRDTCLTWLERAGCDDAEIGSVSAHAFARQASILRHYVKRHDPKKAARAMAKLEAWLAEQTAAARKVQ